jgi:YVTN family beta-propeller protein
VQLCSADDGNAIVALASGSTFVTILDGETATVRAKVELGPSPWNAIARGPLVYVAMHTADPASDCVDALQVVDVVTGRLAATIPLPTGSRPKNVVPAFERDRVYSLNSGNGTISEVDIGSQRVTRTIETGLGPQYGQRSNGVLYVLNGRSNDVAIVDESTFTLLGRVPVGRGAERCVVYRNRGQVYTNNLDDDTISIVDLQAQSVVATVPVGHGPLRITPWDARDRDEWVVLCRGGADGSAGSIVFVDSDTHQVTDTFELPGPVANWNWGLGPRHQSVYVALANQPTLVVLDAARLEILDTLHLSAQPEPAGYGPGLFNSSSGRVFIACTDAVAVLSSP